MRKDGWAMSSRAVERSCLQFPGRPATPAESSACAQASGTFAKSSWPGPASPRRDGDDARGALRFGATVALSSKPEISRSGLPFHARRRQAQPASGALQPARPGDVPVVVTEVGASASRTYHQIAGVGIGRPVRRASTPSSVATAVVIRAIRACRLRASAGIAAASPSNTGRMGSCASPGQHTQLTRGSDEP